jgi:hypothetical protein
MGSVAGVSGVLLALLSGTMDGESISGVEVASTVAGDASDELDAGVSALFCPAS